MKFKSLQFVLLILFLASACQAAGDSMTSTSTLATSGKTPVAVTPVPPVLPTKTDQQAGEYTDLRQEMVAQQIAPRDIHDERVLETMLRVPRHAFVPEDMRHLAYEDHPLPIGYGQTISQPYIVALMTQSLEPQSGQKILEIGTGSGYQAAILAEIGVEVYTVEIIPELAKRAADTLDSQGYTEVHTLNADGYFGWQEFAPYDAIIVTAAPDHLPQPLVNQLVEGGRLVIPIGPIGFVQTLWLFEKTSGEMQATNLGAVTFVPLTGEH